VSDATNKTDAKFRYMLSTRIEKSYAEVVDRLLALHGGLQFSKYLRGLIYADAVRCDVPTVDLDRPAWVTKSYPELFDVNPDKEKAPPPHGHHRKRKKK
jgi:hypothetical protein